jgi:ADP-ribose pyrophosphatase YjhB (NUDIX family)
MSRRASVIVWFRDPETGDLKVLSGRENAVYQGAVGQLTKNISLRRELAAQRDVLDGSGANTALQIGRNLSGALLVGRTALPGGRLERGESYADGALRELKEEFGLENVAIDQLVSVTYDDQPKNERFFSLDLELVFGHDVAAAAARFAAEFKPNSEKRELEVVDLDRLADLLAAPDERDVEFLTTEMAKLAGKLCQAGAGRDKFASDLLAYQRSRSLQNQIDAVRAFVASMSASASE